MCRSIESIWSGNTTGYANVSVLRTTIVFVLFCLDSQNNQSLLDDVCDRTSVCWNVTFSHMTTLEISKSFCTKLESISHLPYLRLYVLNDRLLCCMDSLFREFINYWQVSIPGHNLDNSNVGVINVINHDFTCLPLLTHPNLCLIWYCTCATALLHIFCNRCSEISCSKLLCIYHGLWHICFCSFHFCLFVMCEIWYFPWLIEYMCVCFLEL